MGALSAGWRRGHVDGAYLGFFQATFLPSLLHSLEPFDTASELESIVDSLEAAIRSAIKTDPQPFAQIPLHMATMRRI